FISLFRKKLRLADGRHKQDVAVIRNARAAQVRVRKAVDDVVRIVITRAAVPVVGARVGRKLHQPERRGRSWKRVPVSARADERVDVMRVIAGLRGNGEQRAVSREQYEDAKAKDVFMYVHLWSILTLVLLFLIHSPVVYGGGSQYLSQ